MLLDLPAKSDEVDRRAEMAAKLDRDHELRTLALMHFAESVENWIDDWAWAYNPKELDMPSQPFRLSRKQRELVRWIDGIVSGRHEGVIEKSRDVGVTWICALYALNRFLFVPGFKTGFGSYHADKVDRLGDPDSIFEKIRIAMDMLPTWQMPKGWDRARHDNYMRLINPITGSTITGEVGANMGRGGRNSLYVVDEAAFVEQATRAARAVSATSDAKIWMSTANGMANAFYSKRELIRERTPELVFQFHYRDDPRKTPAWAKREREAMEPADWASEYEIDYGASVERQLIRAEWVQACVHLGRARSSEIDGPVQCGLDVGAGKAESVLVTVCGALVLDVAAWRDPDAVDTAAAAVDRVRALGADVLKYDATGVGFAQGAIMSRMDNGKIRVMPINLGDPAPSDVRIVEGDHSIPASERFANLKAFGWWQLRERAKASWELAEGLVDHELSNCLLLGVDDRVLIAQLAQPTWSKNLRGKRQVDKAPDGAKSPDRADALVLALLPARSRQLQVGRLLGI